MHFSRLVLLGVCLTAMSKPVVCWLCSWLQYCLLIMGTIYKGKWLLKNLFRFLLYFLTSFCTSKKSMTLSHFLFNLISTNIKGNVLCTSWCTQHRVMESYVFEGGTLGENGFVFSILFNLKISIIITKNCRKLDQNNSFF